ncbi:MAG: lipoyl synthase [Desulfobacterales bacterium]
MARTPSAVKGYLSPKPPWLRRRLPSGPAYEQMRRFLADRGLHTVCQEARCPNIWECFSKKTATFLILGNRCTRNCRFCAVGRGTPLPLDPGEPSRVADAVKETGLEYAVITSVTRDDIGDGGAGLFADTIKILKKEIPKIGVEVLTPDFRGDLNALNRVISTGPDVFNHNIETVPRLYPSARPQADYQRSLDVLKAARHQNPGITTKSGIMAGLGEEEKELEEVFEDLLAAGCSILTIGQYLQPALDSLTVKRFIPPEEFREMKTKALAMGFDAVESGPFVRSSYNAKELFRESMRQRFSG